MKQAVELENPGLSQLKKLKSNGLEAKDTWRRDHNTLSRYRKL